MREGGSKTLVVGNQERTGKAELPETVTEQVRPEARKSQEANMKKPWEH